MYFLADRLSPTHSIAAADEMLDEELFLGHDLHRGMPTNNSVNLPLRDGMGRRGPISLAKTNGTTVGRKLPNLSMLYGRGPTGGGIERRRPSAESQQPLNSGSIDSNDESGPSHSLLNKYRAPLSSAQRFVFVNRKYVKSNLFKLVALSFVVCHRNLTMKIGMKEERE